MVSGVVLASSALQSFNNIHTISWVHVVPFEKKKSIKNI